MAISSETNSIRNSYSDCLLLSLLPGIIGPLMSYYFVEWFELTA